MLDFQNYFTNKKHNLKCKIIIKNRKWEEILSQANDNHSQSKMSMLIKDEPISPPKKARSNKDPCSDFGSLKDLNELFFDDLNKSYYTTKQEVSSIGIIAKGKVELQQDDTIFTDLEIMSLEKTDVEISQESATSDYDLFMGDDTIFDESEILTIERNDVIASQRRQTSEYLSLMDDNTVFDESEILSIELNDIAATQSIETSPEKSRASEFELFMDDNTVFDESEILSIERNHVKATQSIETSPQKSQASEFDLFMDDNTVFDESEILSIELNDIAATQSVETSPEKSQASEFESIETSPHKSQASEFELFMEDNTVFDESEILSIERNHLEATQSIETSPQKSQASEFDLFMDDNTVFDESEILSIERNHVEATQSMVTSPQKRNTSDESGIVSLEINDVETNQSKLTLTNSQEIQARIMSVEKCELDLDTMGRSPQKYLAFKYQFDKKSEVMPIQRNEEEVSHLMITSPQKSQVKDDKTTLEEWDLQFQERKGKLNKGQRELFDFVNDQILKESRGEKCLPIKLFITGSAGTGKSYVLNLLVDQIRRTCGSNRVRVCAATGAAAILVNGQTIHSTFKFNVTDSRRPERTLFKNLDENDFRDWRPVKFLIIDEVSMLSYEFLSKINKRMQELKHNQDFFGQVNVLLFGDLFQLPPITGNPVFLQPAKYKKCVHLFRLFKFCELTEIERQRGNIEFIDLLNNLRVNRLTDQQYAVLKEKFENQSYVDEKMLRIVPLRKMAEDHNEMIIKKTQKPKMNLTAIDRLIELRDKKVLRHSLDEIVPKDCNLTYGVLKELVIFEGQRVMLRVNIDLSLGLVNGSLGEIITIQMMESSPLPKVLVNFDKAGLHWIPPKDVDFEAKFNYGTIRRTMIPLIPAYAITVHKLQGCTVERAAINLGCRYFEPGQKFVALSRVSTLEGIEVLDISEDRLVKGNIVDQRCLEEMERLRKLPKFNQ